MSTKIVQELQQYWTSADIFHFRYFINSLTDSLFSKIQSDRIQLKLALICLDLHSVTTKYRTCQSFNKTEYFN